MILVQVSPVTTPEAKTTVTISSIKTTSKTRAKHNAVTKSKPAISKVKPVPRASQGKRVKSKVFSKTSASAKSFHALQQQVVQGTSFR